MLTVIISLSSLSLFLSLSLFPSLSLLQPSKLSIFEDHGLTEVNSFDTVRGDDKDDSNSDSIYFYMSVNGSFSECGPFFCIGHKSGNLYLGAPVVSHILQSAIDGPKSHDILPARLDMRLLHHTYRTEKLKAITT